MTAHLKTVSIVVCTLLVSGAATAGAATLISGKSIKKGSIPYNRLSDGTKGKITAKIPFSRLSTGTQNLIKDGAVSGQSVVPGPKGAKGDKGIKGDKGDKGDTGSVAYSGPHWGVIDRNTIGSPLIALRSGPYVAPGTGVKAPPLGIGSLGLAVANVPGNTEKASFGNETDFVGNDVADLTEAGFSVYWTGEDKTLSTGNLPNITFEVDPTGLADTAAPGFSSLVFVPAGGAALPSNQWNAFDATDGAVGGWYFTNGTTATATGCSSSDFCTFDEMKTAVGTSYPSMDVLSLAVVKGRDNAFQGAVDALRYNDEVYDFEPFGVTTTDAP